MALYSFNKLDLFEILGIWGGQSYRDYQAVCKIYVKKSGVQENFNFENP